MTRQQEIFSEWIKRMACVFDRETPMLDIQFAWQAGYYAGRDQLLCEQIAKLKEPVRARCVKPGALHVVHD